MMIEVVTNSQKSVNFYQTTRRNVPEDSHLYRHVKLFFLVKPVQEMSEEVLWNQRIEAACRLAR
jgi:hypothetical protein